LASRRPNINPVRAEGTADFTSRKRRVDAPKLLKAQSENFEKVFADHLLGPTDALTALAAYAFFLSMSL
jgi:hypothetical protein